MSAAANLPDEEKPLDPAVEAVRKRLARLLMVSIGIMMIGLFAVLGAIVYRLQDRAPAMQPDAAIMLPQGAAIISESLDGDRILLRLKLADGAEMMVIHSATDGALLGRLAVATMPQN
jgi:hypothetical protein